MTKPIEVTDATFEELVLKADLPTLVDFWAIWCMPCIKIAPVVEEIAAEYLDKLQVTKLDVDKNSQTAIEYNVMSIPTLMVFKGGEAVERIVGFRSKADLLSKIIPHLASDGDITG
ncbi:MAG: thioredoxin [Anaerolineae bacterium]|nr:thioredoxin [Anaerolineae bacterium]